MKQVTTSLAGEGSFPYEWKAAKLVAKGRVDKQSHKRGRMLSSQLVAQVVGSLASNCGPGEQNRERPQSEEQGQDEQRQPYEYTQPC